MVGLMTRDYCDHTLIVSTTDNREFGGRGQATENSRFGDRHDYNDDDDTGPASKASMLYQWEGRYIYSGG
ncbi:uncharacterized protein Z519_03392 [Cladophialophora bantiana CBS 173.52]|uniref:Uncharacterized protein n=1 Tax=Cladophialophora bantiana (strain ATCC 10958 / CBS 173.52 / CDC B-1940 / NIH 8579) TaxID=1442370 RepID=A0A0D2HS70_CLAB1|nr:uncharacterized protein Z519_03392 [Cladophialophora bantiana CBS 173.52]KIW96323.1 hypothetical protein Z519_03392 [Cladophialophora bantiana CBS 173.52]